jgi:hypothetical protein
LVVIGQGKIQNPKNQKWLDPSQHLYARLDSYRSSKPGGCRHIRLYSSNNLVSAVVFIATRLPPYPVLLFVPPHTATYFHLQQDDSRRMFRVLYIERGGLTQPSTWR